MTDEYWQPITAGNDVPSTCFNCPPKPSMLPTWLDPGFGCVVAQRDGTTIFVSERASTRDIRRIRKMAACDPDCLWTIEYNAPLTAVRYTRQPNGRWIATHRGMGFA